MGDTEVSPFSFVVHGLLVAIKCAGMTGIWGAFSLSETLVGWLVTIDQPTN
ncbi:hypothetical protein [Thioclava sp.]|uniref:hypothetical protein n=1 Tax=Thioclava sp. TaxID=1933450 RepID=UPI003AA84E5D